MTKKILKILLIVLVLGVFILFLYIMNTFTPIAGGKDKPIIYLYPEKETEIMVKIHYEGELGCTYPEYKEGWHVKATPDGDLINIEDSKEYSYLFWEGKDDYKWDLDTGFVIEGDKTAEFLQEKLAYMGLTPKEYNEFIVFWLPKMEGNKYNLIYFAGEDYQAQARLEIEPKPDSLLRVFMVFKPLDRAIEIKEQVLAPFSRYGFTVVEWGGTELK